MPGDDGDAHRGQPGGTTTTKACGMLDVTDYIYVLAIVGVLLLPDIKSLKIGGFEFERLTTEVAKQTTEIGQLRQQISAVQTNTNNIRLQVGRVAGTVEGLSDFFKQQMDVLRKNHDLLPEDEQTTGDLEKVYAVERRIDAGRVNQSQIIAALQIQERLVNLVLGSSATEGDTALGAQNAQNAQDVLQRFGLLGDDPAGS